MESEIYRHARYYEIAFGFVDAKAQVDLFEAFIKDYSSIEVRSVLDICCGTALQLRELARRGYSCFGLDGSHDMLDYLQQKADEEQLSIQTLHSDMTDFLLDPEVDFCYIMMGSLPYVRGRTGLLMHLSSVARSLKPGGLYLIENGVTDWTNPEVWVPQTWRMEEQGITVDATYQITPLDWNKQIVQQAIDLIVDDNGRRTQLTERVELKLILPQEFKTLIEMDGRFEFIGFFERDSTTPIDTPSANNTVLIRKR